MAQLKPIDKHGKLLKVGDIVDIELSDAEYCGEIKKIDGDVISIRTYGFDDTFYKDEQYNASQAEKVVMRKRSEVKALIGKDLKDLDVKHYDSLGWSAVVSDDEIIDFIPFGGTVSLLVYLIDFEHDVKWDDTKNAYDLYNDYFTKNRKEPEYPKKQEKMHKAEEESEDIEIDVVYTYKAKINKKYLEYMISDGITTGSFGCYTDFVKYEAPIGFKGEVPKNASEKIMKGWKITVVDIEDATPIDSECTMKGILSLKTIMKAIQAMAVDHPHLYRDTILKENYDAISAGAMLEIAVFGTIVYA